MGRLYPDDNRRLNRRFGLAAGLGWLGIVLTFGGVFLHLGFVNGLPPWLWLMPLVNGVVLAAVSIAILLAVRRELRHLRLY